MNSIVYLIFSLLAFIAVNAQSSSSGITLQMFSGSNAFWIGIAVQNANVDTASVMVKGDGYSSYSAMSPNPGWGFWTLSSPNGKPFQFPISVLITSISKDQLSATITSLSSTTNTGMQFGSSSPATSAPIQPTAAPVRPTTAPVLPTAAPVKATTAPIQPTAAPVKPTTAPVKATTPALKATIAPVKPTTAFVPPTAAPSLGCAAAIKLLVPLYTYPDAGWDLVAAGASSVFTVAIINPNSGPSNGPDATYNTYMNKLHAAGVDMVGYVHTSYGLRAIADVKADIAKYASEFPHLSGIFLDESASTTQYEAYYTELYKYIMSFPGWKYDIINPGVPTTAGYLQASTQIVTYEDTAAKFSASSNPSYASCTAKDRFAMISHSASASAMKTALSAAKAKGYYGWVYVTDGPAGGTTYNVLTSYYAAQAAYIKTSINI